MGAGNAKMANTRAITAAGVRQMVSHLLVTRHSNCHVVVSCTRTAIVIVAGSGNALEMI